MTATKHMALEVERVMKPVEKRGEQASLRLNDVSKTYSQAGGERTVLDRITTSFLPGEFVAIRGRSGSGKTTLLNLLAGIDEPSEGQIFYGDLSFNGLSREQKTLFRRDHIGFVFQFFNLIPTLTLLENVLLPAELAKRDPGTAKQQATRLLERVGLGGREYDFPDRLSGGEQQRVAIARAMILQPFFILADEPTGNLDRDTGDAVMTLLNALREETGSLLIMVTHSHSLAERSDRVLLLENGKLHQQD